jgi:hypothetical protein
VVCYLPCFREWLITGLLLSFLPFRCLFTDSSRRDQLLVLPLFSGVLSLLDFSSLFIVQLFFWW